MACADVNLDILGDEEESSNINKRNPPLVQEYRAFELVPPRKGPLHNLLQKQPAVLGSLQIVSGLLSVGVGIFFAVTQPMGDSLITMFRVSQLTGILFIIAGVLSNVLFKYPELLHMSFVVNCGCIVVTVVAACVICVDLAYWEKKNAEHLSVEVLALSMMGLEVLLSAILCVFFFKEKRAKST